MATKSAKSTKKSPTKNTTAAKAEPKKPTGRVRSVAGAVRERAVNRERKAGFTDFLREQGVVGLAIGLVLGTQAKSLVDSLVVNFINPLTGLFLPGSGALETKTFVLNLFGKKATFGWGAFISGLLSFVLVAAVIYYVFKGLKLDRLDKKKDA